MRAQFIRIRHCDWLSDGRDCGSLRARASDRRAKRLRHARCYRCADLFAQGRQLLPNPGSLLAGSAKSRSQPKTLPIQILTLQFLYRSFRSYVSARSNGGLSASRPHGLLRALAKQCSSWGGSGKANRRLPNQ